jgi:hypothetical protein
VRAVLREHSRCFAVDIERVADRVVAANFDREVTQETRVAHPVRQLMRALHLRQQARMEAAS